MPLARNVGGSGGGSDSGALQKSANLSDLTSVPTALTNLTLSPTDHVAFYALNLTKSDGDYALSFGANSGIGFTVLQFQDVVGHPKIVFNANDETYSFTGTVNATGFTAGSMTTGDFGANDAAFSGGVTIAGTAGLSVTNDVAAASLFASVELNVGTGSFIVDSDGDVTAQAATFGGLGVTTPYLTITQPDGYGLTLASPNFQVSAPGSITFSSDGGPIALVIDIDSGTTTGNFAGDGSQLTGIDADSLGGNAAAAYATLTGNETLTNKSLTSPALTGTPTAPTASAATSTTQIATTAFATTADNLKANLASPTFTGTVTTPNLAVTTSLAVNTSKFTVTSAGLTSITDTSTTSNGSSLFVTRSVTDPVTFAGGTYSRFSSTQSSAFNGENYALVGEMWIVGSGSNNWTGNGAQGQSGAVGVMGRVEHRSGTITIAQAESFVSQVEVGANGTITNYAAYRVLNPVKHASATLTNVYGLYVNSLSVGTNLWGVYVAGANDSYFGGKVGIGTNSGITSALTLATGTTAAGGILFGSGNSNLYRSGNNTLKTDGNLVVIGNSNVTGANNVTGVIQTLSNFQTNGEDGISGTIYYTDTNPEFGDRTMYMRFAGGILVSWDVA